MRDHIVQVNPASFVKKPSVRTRKAANERLSPEQLGGFFAGLKGRTRIVVWVGAKHTTLIRDVGQSVLEGVSAVRKWLGKLPYQSLRMRDDSKSAVHA
jgi:hypothetical protein